MESVARGWWSTVRMGVLIEYGNAIWTCIITSECWHAWQRKVARQSRWLFWQHLGFALSALQLRLLLLFRLGAASQHVGSPFS
jgi:hypothetical protein